MFTILSLKNPIYTKEDQTGIDCEIQFEEFANNPSIATVPFHATADDPEPHGQEIYNDLKAGKYGPIAPYVAPVITSANNQPVTTGTKAA